MAGILSKVVLVGASGTVGAHVLKALLSNPVDKFQVLILTRPDSNSTFPSHENVTVLSLPHDDLSSLISAFSGYDAVVHAGGIASLKNQELMIEAAVKAGVKRFVLNEFANSPINQVGLPEFEPFRTTKREILELAKRKAKDVEGFSWTALATGNFLDYSLRKFPQFGFDIAARKARLVDDGSERFSAVVLEDIGIAVRGILKQPEQTKNRFCHIRSVETCQKDILEALRGEMDGEWQVECVNGQEMYVQGKEEWASGQRSGRIKLLVVQLCQKGGNRSIVVGQQESDNELLGVREKDVREVVKEVWNTF